jgi:hypothetical protein
MTGADLRHGRGTHGKESPRLAAYYVESAAEMKAHAAVLRGLLL